MNIVKKIKNAIRVRDTEAELSRMSDHDLKDVGISRCDIPRIAREAVYGK
jgi:uncharacterized protein YjiS (DUF1127 family)